MEVQPQRFATHPTPSQILLLQQHFCVPQIPCMHPFFACSYTYTLNAFAARLTPLQVRLLQQHPSVAHVQKDHILRTRMTYSPRFLRVAKYTWPMVGGQWNAGKGKIIGVIDSGIWPEHPSFSNVSADLEGIPASFGKWVGVSVLDRAPFTGHMERAGSV